MERVGGKHAGVNVGWMFDNNDSILKNTIQMTHKYIPNGTDRVTYRDAPHLK